MSSPKFSFVHLPNKTSSFLLKKTNLDYLMKWSMKGHFRILYYNFNQPFQVYDKDEFVQVYNEFIDAFFQAFFNDPNVYTTLVALDYKTWSTINSPAAKVDVQQIPCTITSMTFFDKILDESNGIVRGGKGHILQCMEELTDDFYINDHLRALLLDPSHDCYNILTSSERAQFIFLLFKHLCLGGKWCQNEDIITPYLDLTKELYKDIIGVRRTIGQQTITVQSLVLKVIAYGSDDEAIFPQNPHHIQNFAYLIIDPFKRQVTVLIHQFGALFNV